MIKDIRDRFKSSNSVPIERAHITASEWAYVEDLLDGITRQYQFAMQTLCEETGMEYCIAREMVLAKMLVNTVGVPFDLLKGCGE